MESVLIYLIPVVALAALFFLLWWLDARRSEKVAHDPERTDAQPDNGGHAAQRHRGEQ